MSDPSRDTANPAGTPTGAQAGPASHLDIPAERRALHNAHAAVLAVTARRVALEVPFGADVDDFRRVLAAGAKL
jgi:hypothetical protein